MTKEGIHGADHALGFVALGDPVPNSIPMTFDAEAKSGKRPKVIKPDSTPAVKLNKQ
ncbi:MAG: hypothetical protein HY424_03215 [Candidatus Levybacteria bacterium]|nr:hypothetical protein [Candidatus Levybacteria bacterium]